MPPIPPPRILAAGLVLGGVWSASPLGCAASTRRTPTTYPAFVEGPGDWDDVSAVVAGIVPRLDYVLDSPSITNDDHYIVAIFSPRFGPGSLSIDRLEDNQVRIDASIGRFGEPDEEEYMERAIASRFKRLLGDVVAPIELPPRQRP